MLNQTSKVIIFGNSSSGKSTLAVKLNQELGLPHLDLDTLAWEATEPPVRKPIKTSTITIQNFMQQHKVWVIEGCYTDLLKVAYNQASVVVFMNVAVSQCQKHARSRPWEKHKYASKAEQDANLPMLLDWISQYENRKDEFSLAQHQQLYNQFDGLKMMVR